MITHLIWIKIPTMFNKYYILLSKYGLKKFEQKRLKMNLLLGLLLFFDIFDHYDQSSVDNPRKKNYLKYLISSGVFIFIQWIVNLIFFINTKRGWEKDI